MNAQPRPYDHDRHFIRVRDFLADNYPHFGTTTSWRIERWNYARYFIAPMLGAGLESGGHEFSHTDEEGLAGIRIWETDIGVWEDEAGEIAAVVHGESDGPGCAFTQRRRGADCLLEETVAHAEAHLVHPVTGELHLYVPDGDATLTAEAAARGYAMNAKWRCCDSEFDCTKVPPMRLPDGFTIRSMADTNDFDAKRRGVGLGFDHPDPKDWASAFCYREMAKAPDYRADLDLFVVEPGGEYVSCCCVWYDTTNRVGALEPLCTHPDYRRRGFGREVVYEAIRRVAALGARSVWVGTDKPFYLAIGFEVRHTAHVWQKG